MLDTGDTAPDFTAPLADGDVSEFSLSTAVEDGPVVLAFFPGAFTSVCSHEMEAFDDRLSAFDDAGASVYGVSVDTPFAQNAFREELGLDFDLVSDTNREVIDAYGLSMDFAGLGVYNLAKRSVYVVGPGREVTYAWVSKDPGVEPDYDAVLEAADAA